MSNMDVRAGMTRLEPVVFGCRHENLVTSASPALAPGPDWTCHALASRKGTTDRTS